MTAPAPVMAGPVTEDEIRQGKAAAELQRAILRLVDWRDPTFVPGWADLSDDERTVVLAEALQSRELSTDSCCPDAPCAGHAAALDALDAYRRLAYARLPGSPLIDVDLP